MESSLPALLTAAWLGILTSISPCPLASNIAALSYIGKDLERKSSAVVSGLFYTFGRVIAYVVISAAVVAGVLAVPTLAQFLQVWMNRFLGPLLVFLALVLFGLIKFPTISFGAGNKLKRVARHGSPGAAALGFIFALSFCPISAALFFGSLIPLALKEESKFLIPSMFGIGTAAPIAIFAVMLAVGAHSLGNNYNQIAGFARWARKITGVIFFMAAGYYILTYWFGVNLWG
jgi:thiol:disulfide interchange protein